MSKQKIVGNLHEVAETKRGAFRRRTGLSRKMLARLPVMLLAAGLAFSTAGCATLTWNSPVTEEGSAGALKTAEETAGGKEIASYSVILGFIVLGKTSFNGLTVAAARQGKKVDFLTANFFVFQKVTAYAR